MFSGQRIGPCPFRPASEAHAMSQFLGEPSGLSPWFQNTLDPEVSPGLPITPPVPSVQLCCVSVDPGTSVQACLSICVLNNTLFIWHLKELL